MTHVTHVTYVTYQEAKLKKIRARKEEEAAAPTKLSADA